MHLWFERFLRIFLMVSLFWAALPGSVNASVNVQSLDPRQKAQRLMTNLSPEEKIGQLFLVTFKGRDVSKTSQIYDLVYNRHIGGVMLRNANDNFTGPENTLKEAQQMVSDLQKIGWTAAQAKAQPTKNASDPDYIPLFIGVSQEGDGYPYDQILNGLSPLPDEMAIGATWKPDLSFQVGTMLGSELQALGINFYAGPALDVLDVLPNETSEDLGTRTFGADPFWAGEMGKAYIQGLHKGSQGRIAVIPTHFPGRGGSDRPLEEEVATVRKSLEQLKQIELAPFFSVTGGAPSRDAAADGLLVSHTRYQGFQGNVRATTRPVSLDGVALEQLMALKQLGDWRNQGGLMVSDDLGSQAIRKLYDPTGKSFDASQVARSAFLAGNDVLYADNFAATGAPDSYTAMINTLELFTQKYKEDPSFAQRVNASVERILTLKYTLFPDFEPEAILPTVDDLAKVGTQQQVSFDVAAKAVTLISPEPAELNALIPRPPEARERIVFVTDVITGKQCSQCNEQTVMGVDALQSTVLKLYGTRSGGQIQPNKLLSYSFAELLGMLNKSAPQLATQTPQLETDLRLADWVVFGAGSVSRNRPESQALKRLLAERPDLLRNKRVIVFAFNAPYYLDATDISKITAYYGLYSKTNAFVDTAVRILFQELSPVGALPVSVPGVGYDLIKATSPDPNQVIQLFLDFGEPNKQATPTFLPPNAKTLQPPPSPTATAVPLFKVGDILPLRTGVILDRNKNSVPDGTVVRFTITTGGGESRSVLPVETVSVKGIARTNFRIQNPGFIEVAASSDLAVNSDIFRLDILPGQAAAITAIVPTSSAPTQTPVPTKTTTPTPTATPTPPPAPPAAAGFVDWILAVLVAWGSAAGVFWVGRRLVNLRWGVRWGFCTALGGLIVYVYVAFNLPGVQSLIERDGSAGVAAVTLLGALAGWSVGWLWRWLLEQNSQAPQKQN